MLRTLRLLVPVSMLVMLVGVLAGPAQAATWSSSAQWGTWTNGGYTLYNNIWGGGAGPQTIWANSYGNWGVVGQPPQHRRSEVLPQRHQEREPAHQRPRQCE